MRYRAEKSKGKTRLIRLRTACFPLLADAALHAVVLFVPIEFSHRLSSTIQNACFRIGVIDFFIKALILVPKVKVEREGGKYALRQLFEVAFVMIRSHCRIIFISHAIRFHEWIHDTDADITFL